MLGMAEEKFILNTDLPPTVPTRHPGEEDGAMSGSPGRHSVDREAWLQKDTALAGGVQPGRPAGSQPLTGARSRAASAALFGESTPGSQVEAAVPPHLRQTVGEEGADGDEGGAGEEERNPEGANPVRVGVRVRVRVGVRVRVRIRVRRIPQTPLQLGLGSGVG